MVELEHRATPPAALTVFCNNNPDATANDFDSPAFQSLKNKIKEALNQDQGGLCVYCEQELAATAGQIEHIKPKGGENAHPDLCFSYSNYAHSCINNKTCGQKKNGLLPIEPGPGCNSKWTLTDDGTIEPVNGLTKADIHTVKQTRDMLGLNADSDLVDDRKKWLKQTIAVLQHAPADVHIFLQLAPFRHILTTVV